MSFPPSSSEPDGIRRRPNIFSFLSFRSPSAQNSEPGSPLFGSSAAGSSGSGLFEKEPLSNFGYGAPSIIEAAKSRIGKTVIFILVVAFGFLFYFSPSSSSVSRFVEEHSSIGHATDSLLLNASAPGVCSKSYDGKKPITQYALMVDAGSTGSRIHVYEFSNCQATPELVREVFEMTKPGLSSYPNDPQAAAESLDPLIEVAVREVPDDIKACTPIAVKATAGLRILGQAASEKILAAVRTHLETKYPFPVVAGDGVSIMDGKDEGVYAWITTNFLLGNIGSKEDIPTAAVFDLGGGSTQIVFEPTFPVSEAGVPEQMTHGDHKYDLNFGGRHFTLYQHSHLGYGLMEARKKVHQAVVQAALEKSETIPKTLVNPCLPPKMIREVEVELSADKKVKVNMTGPAEPSSSQCRFLTEKILQKEAACTVAPCSFNGVHQPSLSRTFAKEDIFIFSYFFDRTYPLGMPHSFSLSELRDLTSRVCKGQPGWDSFAAIPGALDELEDRPEWCLDLNFMVSILHSGYDIPLDREVKIAKKLKGNELGWCLGASLPLLDKGSAGWECKINQIS
ncbi:nucleoside phosphatase family-domain-containing protein [Lipomyces japonicus]|uniref:nucleoside phosphatase family-domain-containing protein n=1 Tax=Lipomyces japonicus TaxID=56871 RepID=UPI0034CE4BEB